jgi:uncharacterized protein (DUF2249 family)
MIFARFDARAAGESFVLVNSHDPVHLRQEFARDRPGAYDWRYLEGSRSEMLWWIRIIRITTNPGYHNVIRHLQSYCNSRLALVGGGAAQKPFGDKSRSVHAGCSFSFWILSGTLIPSWTGPLNVVQTELRAHRSATRSALKDFWIGHPHCAGRPEAVALGSPVSSL